MGEQLYATITAGEGSLREKGSKFFAYSYPVTELAEIDAHLQALKKKYHDARHHCYAYRLGKKGEKSFSTDDREPGNSAGPPILAAIRSADLTNTLVIVVRYFGGTKLGIRGLIEAYRGAAEIALVNSQRSPIIPKIQFSIRYAYDKTSAINKILHPFTFEVLAADYTEICVQTLAIREGEYPALYKQLTEAGFEVSDIKGI